MADDARFFRFFWTMFSDARILYRNVWCSTAIGRSVHWPFLRFQSWEDSIAVQAYVPISKSPLRNHQLCWSCASSHGKGLSDWFPCQLQNHHETTNLCIVSYQHISSFNFLVEGFVLLLFFANRKKTMIGRIAIRFLWVAI